MAVSAPTDSLEREADRVADEVMGSGRGQRRTDSAGGKAFRPEIGPTVAHGLAGGGEVLPRSTREHFEPRFGHDFSTVRVHADAEAASSAAALQASAFTFGSHIVFGAGRYRPGNADTQRLLAHELTHVAQQDRLGLTGVVHRDFAVAPRTPAGVAAALTPTQIASAITFNGATITQAAEIQLLRDIVGLDPAPAVVDGAFVQAVADFQAQHGLTADGKIGPSTRRRLSLEILAEARSLGSTGLGGLHVGLELRSQIETLIGAGNRTYADWRTRIRAATVLQRDVVLAEPAFLIRMRNHLSTFNDLARCIELLGRRAPTHGELIADPIVIAELRAVWAASSPTLNPPGGTQHEEGGWVYMNIITNEITVRRAPAGQGAIIDLTGPPVVADSIVVGTYHTHPNLGPAWTAGPSGPDGVADAADAVPGIVVGSTGLTAADPVTFFASGPNRRAHLAGSQGLPSAPVAPQAKADGTYDER
ncbi:Putative peptidoglycan binding domain-containing protein [Geodermatophilus pulveris]|uniref:Putative peptidoglycan binding domain-containing protein n=1 Tax=Geodermatophilus pulveris TaxID=1564159 RepID=A0A239C141_9ACTN|nr:Putative peptidoglycan binding domain-containing protein [Geodermatophilus pulveris]